MKWGMHFTCLLSVDGVDSSIKEPFPFHKTIYLEKLNDPGLKYEVDVCIKTGYICWVNGPFKAGTHNVTVFKNGLKLLL